MHLNRLAEHFSFATYLGNSCVETTEVAFRHLV